MATARRELDPDLNRARLRHLLEAAPQCVRFFQAVRLLTQISPERQPVGGFASPEQEAVRFGAHASTSFPASEIQGIGFPLEAPPHMQVNFMGLTGPEGALPLAYTELLMERVRGRDAVLRDFLDVFNHRLISLFYRAWEKSHFVVEPDTTADQLSRCLLALLGIGTAGLQDRQRVADCSLLHYAGLLAAHARSAAGLQDLLSDYFDVPVEIVQFAGAWCSLTQDDQTCLREGDSFPESLGRGATLGDELWDQQSRVCIRVGPLELERYLDFLPGGSAHEALRALVRFYFNDQLDFQLRLVLKREVTPRCELGRTGTTAPRLGWVTWLRSGPRAADPDETTLPL